MIICVVCFAGVLFFSIRNGEIEKKYKIVLMAILGVFEIAFLVYHPVLWGIHVGSFALSIAYFIIGERATANQVSGVFPFLGGIYLLGIITSGSLILSIVEAFAGRFF
jgi:hypothetical protein